MISLDIPAGKYWLGDPLYIIKEEMWKSWIGDYLGEKSFLKNTSDNYFAMAFKLPKLINPPMIALHKPWLFNTYLDKNEKRYGTDSGLIGLVDYDHHHYGQSGRARFNLVWSNRAAKLIEHDRSFKAEYYEDRIIFGDIEISLEPIPLLEENEEEGTLSDWPYH